MTISSHHYRGVINNANNLITKVQDTMSPMTKDGFTKTISFVDEIFLQYTEWCEKIGELNVLIDGLVNSSLDKKEYINIRTELINKKTYWQLSCGGGKIDC